MRSLPMSSSLGRDTRRSDATRPSGSLDFFAASQKNLFVWLFASSFLDGHAGKASCHHVPSARCRFSWWAVPAFALQPHKRQPRTQRSYSPTAIYGSYGSFGLLCSRQGSRFMSEVDPGAKSIDSESAKGHTMLKHASSPCISSSTYAAPSNPLETLSRFVAAG